MTFRDSVNFSNDTFFDMETFAEDHMIEYQAIQCVLDTDIYGRDTNHEKGKKDIRIFIRQSEVEKYPKFPKSEGENINVDGSEFIIESWSVESGVHVIYAFRYGE